ncbi:MAG: Eco57I restriction-modification methylase domain-containing protein [Candidatus Helarchaeota archaeon]
MPRIELSSSKNFIMTIEKHVKKTFPLSYFFSDANYTQFKRVIKSNPSLFLIFKQIHGLMTFDLLQVLLEKGSAIFYELFLAITPEINQARSAYVFKRIPKNRRKTGSFFTPQQIIDLMISLSLKRLIVEKIRQVFNEYRRKSSKNSELQSDLLEKILNALFSLRILDPCVGGGQFLLRSVEYLTDVMFRAYKWFLQGESPLSKNEIKQMVIKKCIFGLDIDKFAIELTSSLFWFNVKNTSLEVNLKKADFLIHDEWNDNFPEKFDLIIGNPPWGMKIPDEQRKRLEMLYPSVNDYESFQYFSLAALKNVEEEGYLSFIVPNTLALNVLAQPFRKILLQDNSLIHIVNFSNSDIFKRDDIFKLQPIVRALIYVLQKNVKHETCKVHVLSSNHEINTHSLPLHQLSTARTWATFLHSGTYLKKIIRRIVDVSVPLGSISVNKQGYIPYRTTTLEKRLHGVFSFVFLLLHPQDLMEFIHSPSTNNFIKRLAKSMVKNRTWHSSEKRDERYLPEIRGARIVRYGIKPPDLWILYGKHVSTHIPLDFFTRPRLLFREILGHPPHSLHVAYTTDVLIHNPSVLNAVLNEPFVLSPYYLLCILNSTLISAYAKLNFPKATKGFDNKILIEDVRNLPIRQIKIPQEFTDDDSSLMALMEKFSRFIAGSNNEQLIINDLQVLLSSNQLSVIHDFMTYLGFYMSDLVSVQCRNSISRKHLGSRLKQNLPKLQDDIERIDKLIDKIVYLLFGFSMEERKTILKQLNQME